MEIIDPADRVTEADLDAILNKLGLDKDEADLGDEETHARALAECELEVQREMNGGEDPEDETVESGWYGIDDKMPEAITK